MRLTILLVVLLLTPNSVYGVQASWYSTEACQDSHCLTADGSSLYELEARHERFCASWDYPLGTKLNVYSVKSQHSTQVIVRDRGPTRRLARRFNRRIDLSREAFQDIGNLREGIIEVTIKEDPTDSSSWKKRAAYE